MKDHQDSVEPIPKIERRHSNSVVWMRVPRRRSQLVALVLILLVIGLVAWLVAPALQRSRKTGGPVAEDRQPRAQPPSAEYESVGKPVRPAADDDPAERLFADQRQRMVERQLLDRDITDQRVLEVMGRAPRHRFVPEDLRDYAYRDRPLPIGHDQTISQPYIVALMTQLARPQPTARALDIGTGSGYQAAVLAELCQQVYSIEILKPLAESARGRLKELGYGNIEVRCGDGYRGWPQHAPFDVIIVAAAPDHVPKPLLEQLAIGGRLVIPVGRYFQFQHLLVCEKRRDGSIHQREVVPVAFVPMTGEAQQRGGTE